MKQIATTKKGDSITGQSGSYVHFHETGFGTGMMTTRKKGERTIHTPVNTSVRDVNELLAQNPNFPIKGC